MGRDSTAREKPRIVPLNLLEGVTKGGDVECGFIWKFAIFFSEKIFLS
jgi:hypothetical protein